MALRRNVEDVDGETSQSFGNAQRTRIARSDKGYTVSRPFTVSKPFAPTRRSLWKLLQPRQREWSRSSGAKCMTSRVRRERLQLTIPTG